VYYQVVSKNTRFIGSLVKLVVGRILVAESVPLSRSAFCEGRGVGVRV
jgi:hypothetical protein